MSPADVAIPLIVGLLLAIRPQIFLRKVSSQEEAAKKRSVLRKVGYVLLAVAALYAVLALARA